MIIVFDCLLREKFRIKSQAIFTPKNESMSNPVRYTLKKVIVR